MSAVSTVVTVVSAVSTVVTVVSAVSTVVTVVSAVSTVVTVVSLAVVSDTVVTVVSAVVIVVSLAVVSDTVVVVVISVTIGLISIEPASTFSATTDLYSSFARSSLPIVKPIGYTPTGVFAGTVTFNANNSPFAVISLPFPAIHKTELFPTVSPFNRPSLIPASLAILIPAVKLKSNFAAANPGFPATITGTSTI